MSGTQTNVLPPPLENANGITVKQLRDWLALMPDIESWDGEDPTVWLGDGDVSNEIVGLCASAAGDVFLEIRNDPSTN